MLLTLLQYKAYFLITHTSELLQNIPIYQVVGSGVDCNFEQGVGCLYYSTGSSISSK